MPSASAKARRRGRRRRSRPALPLPELEAVALRIHGPAEAAELHLLDVVIDLDTGVAQLREHGVEVTHREVDDRLLAPRPVVGVLGERRPDVVVVRVLEHNVAVERRHAEVFEVPRSQRLGVLRAEEDASDPGHSLGRLLRHAVEASVP
jgi:hypothetical protein